MNVERLEEIIKVIEEEPRRLDMYEWGHVVSDAFLREHCLLTKMPPCGTVGCIAGWAVYLNEPGLLDRMKSRAQEADNRHHNSQLLYTAIRGELFVEDGEEAVIVRARELLGLSRDEGERLFFVESWPEPFRRCYQTSRMAQQHAECTVGRIRHMIVTGE